MTSRMTPDRSPVSKANDAAFPLCDVANMSATLAGAHPPPATLGNNHRAAKRYLVRWRVAAFVDQRGLHHGHIKDISVTGAALLLDQNFQSIEFIKLHIYVSPPASSRMPCIVEVLGKVVYTIFDSRELRFRTGVHFMQFSTAHDPVFLAHHLANHALTVLV